MAEAAARRWVHAAGIAWLAVMVILGTHSALGFPLSAYSPAPAATAVAGVAWGFTAVSAAGAPRTRGGGCIVSQHPAGP